VLSITAGGSQQYPVWELFFVLRVLTCKLDFSALSANKEDLEF